jgi:D-beta-D-heptose 7-phosphate kinase/D-beta-D-heptose 1-phosphate adenosyltransferase
MDTDSKSLLTRLLNRDDARRRSIVERLRGGTIVFTNGVFDVLHRGHIEYLQEAHRLGNRLFVGLNSDASVRRIKGPQRPLVNEQDRAVALLALRSVDFVVLFDDDTPAELIETIQPHILVKGGDYHADDVVGADFVRAHGGKVVTIPFRDGYSTSALIDEIVERYADSCLKTSHHA